MSPADAQPNWRGVMPLFSSMYVFVAAVGDDGCGGAAGDAPVDLSVEDADELTKVMEVDQCLPEACKLQDENEK